MRATLTVLAVLASASPLIQAEGDASTAASAAKDAEKAVFSSHLFVGRFRMNTPMARLPQAVYPALRDGRIGDAGRILLEAHRAGNLDAYAALNILATPCWSGDFSKHLASKRAQERPAAFERAKTLQLDADGLERLDWAFSADAEADARVRAALCPEDGENLWNKWQEEVRNQPQKGASTPMRLAEAQNLLAAEDPKLRKQGVQQLRELATSSPVAKVTLAGCIREACAPDAGDAADRLNLVLSAAREGNHGALTSLADVRYDVAAPRSSLGLPASERYAWATVARELMTDGCFGTNYFIAWTTTSPERLGLNLLEMPPSEAEHARVRAKEMALSETPTIREALTCNQFDAVMASSSR
jgi:hypothetical protein